MDLNKKRTDAVNAARAAGKMLTEQPRAKWVHKAENDFVTAMDSASEKLIRELLLGANPEDCFFGEEGGGNLSETRRWIVDPIDGTANYAKGDPLYTISIAYELEGEIVVGCVYCPSLDEMFTAVKGEGAFLNGKPIRVSEERNPRESLLHMAFCHRNPKANQIMLERIPKLCDTFSDLRRTGSAAYDLCAIAAGRCEGFCELGLHIWDIAAGVVILREAGGCVSDWREGYDPLKTGRVAASNTLLHETLCNILKVDKPEDLDNL